MPRFALLWPCALVALLACEDGARRGDPSKDATVQDAAADSIPEPGSLINNALWQVLSASDDPFMTTPTPACSPESAGEEFLGGELVYAVRTERCPALTARQASRRAVLRGDTLTIRFYHFALTAPEPATALIVLMLGEQEIFRRELPIPSEESELEGSWLADEDIARGTPLLFHMENHGANEYALISVDVSR